MLLRSDSCNLSKVIIELVIKVIGRDGINIKPPVKVEVQKGTEFILSIFIPEVEGGNAGFQS